jgi:O-acetyl-ADP-ribose deacetylase (regulator of RNase III)
MIEYKSGNILEATAEALVNTVNCVGVMGRGIALQFRNAYPDNYRAYKAACDRKEVVPGRMFAFDLNRFENPKLIINFPTKRHWKGKSRIEDIESGLQDLVRALREYEVKSVAIPPLGCGLGGLEWREVRPMIESALAELPDLRAILFPPEGAPKAGEMVIRTHAPKMTLGRAALLALMGRYLRSLMDDSISLLEVHKLLYFLQEAGQPLNLRYSKGTYGPYAENLRHVLKDMEGHYTIGFGDGADTPDKQIEAKGDSIEAGEAFLARDRATQSRFQRVADLISGFETPFGMELLATVHWVVSRENARTVAEGVRLTHAWGARKAMLTVEHIGIAWDRLESKGWLSPNHS